MSDPWPRMAFSDAVTVNPQRQIVRGAIAPFVDMASLPADTGNVSKVRYRPVRSGGSRFMNGDTLFARITPCTENGKTGLVNCLAPGETATGSTEFIVLGPRPGVTIPRFVYYLAKNPVFRSFAISQMRGTSGRQRVPVTVFDDFEVRLPPLREQRKIAAILSSVDDGIEKTQAVIDQVQVVKRGLMQQLLTRGLPGRHTRFKQTEIGEIPEEWRVVQLGSVCLDVSDGPHFSPKYVDRQNGVPFLSARNIRVDGWALGDVKYVSRQDHSTFCKRSHPAPGDLLYTKGGTVGIARVNDLPFDFSIWVHIALLKLRKECIHEWFLAAMLNSPPCYRQALLYTHGTSNRDLGITRMVRIQFSLPPLQEQIEIAERLRTVDQRNTRELESLAQLKLLKSALMSVLLTGELCVTPDSEDS